MKEDVESIIAKLERENRILRKKLTRSEEARTNLEEAKDRFDKLYQTVIKELDEQKNLLKQREKQFRALIESAPDTTIITDKDEWEAYIEVLRQHPDEQDLLDAKDFASQVLAKC